MSQKLNSAIAVIGIDIGKNSFHIVGHDQRGAIVLRQKWSRGQAETRLANLPPCLIGMEACISSGPLNQGAAAITATSTSIICPAMIVDAACEPRRIALPAISQSCSGKPGIARGAHARGAEALCLSNRRRRFEPYL
jgi:transposase